MSVLVQLNKPSRDFEMIPRRVCRLGLSAEAVGLLVIVACAPEGRKIDAAWIEAETGFRRDKRQLVMRELVGAGLLVVRPEQGTDGRWSKLYVFDWDILLVSPRPEKPLSGDRGRIYRRRQIRSSRSTDFPVIEESETESAAAPAAPHRAKRGQAAPSEVERYARGPQAVASGETAKDALNDKGELARALLARLTEGQRLEVRSARWPVVIEGREWSLIELADLRHELRLQEFSEAAGRRAAAVQPAL